VLGKATAIVAVLDRWLFKVVFAIEFDWGVSGRWDGALDERCLFSVLAAFSYGSGLGLLFCLGQE
jgi:hypothetical protein